MDTGQYDRFLELKAAGRKREATEAVRAFVASFRTLDEKREWTVGFLESGAYATDSRHGIYDQGRIRHEVYVEIVFPVLFAGYRYDDPWSLYWLAATEQNLFSATGLWQKLDYESPSLMLRRAHERDPRSEEIRKALLRDTIGRFGHALHEWPPMILSGMDAASAEEANTMLDEIAFARSLDREGTHTSFLEEAEGSVFQYLNSIPPSKT